MRANTEFVHARVCVSTLCVLRLVKKIDKLFFLLTIAISLYTVPNGYVPPSGTLVIEVCFSNYGTFYNRQYTSAVIEMCSSPERSQSWYATPGCNSSRFTFQLPAVDLLCSFFLGWALRLFPQLYAGSFNLIAVQFCISICLTFFKGTLAFIILPTHAF